jgi:twitching motility protein PilI
MAEALGQMLSAGDAMGVLADLDESSRKAAQQLPQSAPVRDLWDGLVFRTSGVRVVAAMNEISEMLPWQEHVTRVPGARPWMLGLANVRSSLLPVIDLQAYLGANPVVPSNATRVLVLRLRGLVVGLVVSSVEGMRHFPLADRIDDARLKGRLGAYVYQAFRADNEIWPVFNMHAMAADPGFRSAAA